MALCADAVIGNVQEKAIKHFNAPNAEVVCICTLHDCNILEHATICLNCKELSVMHTCVTRTVSMAYSSVSDSMQIFNRNVYAKDPCFMAVLHCCFFSDT